MDQAALNSGCLAVVNIRFVYSTSHYELAGRTRVNTASIVIAAKMQGRSTKLVSWLVQRQARRQADGEGEESGLPPTTDHDQEHLSMTRKPGLLKMWERRHRPAVARSRSLWDS